MSRLTNSKRERIVDNILRIKLGDEETKIKEMETDIASKFYCSSVSLYDQSNMESLPTHLQKETVSKLRYRVKILDANNAGEYFFELTEDVAKTLGRKALIGYAGSYSGCYRSYGELIDITDSNLVSKDLKESIFLYAKTKNRYDELELTISRESRNILKSSNTIKSLLSKWPEVEKYIPKDIHAPMSSEVTKIDTSKVNSLLNSLK